MSSHSFHPTSKACGDPGLGNGYVEGCFLLYTIRKNAIAGILVKSPATRKHVDGCKTGIRKWTSLGASRANRVSRTAVSGKRILAICIG